jgi:hypothetical protein
MFNISWYFKGKLQKTQDQVVCLNAAIGITWKIQEGSSDLVPQLDSQKI